MSEQFQLALPGRIIFGSGVVAQAGALAGELTSNILVVTGKSPERSASILESLAASGVRSHLFVIPKEPSLDIVQEGRLRGLEAQVGGVLAMGGGSVLDAGKAIAALIPNQGEVLDFLEVIGGAKPLAHPALPLVAIPTTAGTGAEATRNAVLHSSSHEAKASLRNSTMLPRVALVDPMLTHTLSPALTATTGLDALTQLIEAFICVKHQPVTDAFCREGLQRAGRALRHVFRDGSNASAREDMCLASLFSGIALANAGLGAVHGFAAPLGGMLGASHGALCASMLAAVLEVNWAASQRSGASEFIHDRYCEIARLLTGNPSAEADSVLAWVRETCSELQISGLEELGLKRNRFGDAVERAKKASSMRGNPVPLSDYELMEILDLSF